MLAVYRLIEYMCNCPFRLNPHVYLKRGGMVEDHDYWRLDKLLKKKAVSMGTHCWCILYTIIFLFVSSHAWTHLTTIRKVRNFF